MEYYGKIACVTVEELTAGDENFPAIMGYYCYKQLVNRGKINVVRPGKGTGSYALIDYSSLPQRYKDAFEAKHGGSPEALLKGQDTCNTFRIDSAARKFYFDKVLKNGEHIPDRTQEEYTVNASVLNALLADYNTQKQLRNALNNGTRINFESIHAKSEQLRRRYGHTLPKNAARLRSKITEYRECGYGCLISGHFANVHSLKVTKAAGDWIIAKRRSRVPVYNIDQIFNEYNSVAPMKGWKALQSKTTLMNFLEAPENKIRWADGVHGEQYAKNLYNYKHKTVMPTMRDALWYGEGTKLNLYYREYAGGKLVIKTLQVYEVIDAYSEVLLGYHISKTEDSVAQYYAYRMAVERAKHRPYEIVHDNQGGHKTLDSQGLFDGICHFHRATAPNSGQSKTIESLFGRFQSQILHRDWRFTGQNVKAKKEDSSPNMEFILSNREHLYTYWELLGAYAAAREEWNAMPHHATGIARNAMYVNSVNPETPEITDIDMIDMFWRRGESTNRFTSGGITIQIEKEKYTYDVFDEHGMPDMEFRAKHTGRDFVIQYDPTDMTAVWLCVESGSGLRKVAQAKPYLAVHRAIQEQEGGDMAFIRQIDELNKMARVRRQIEAAALENVHGVAPEQHGLVTPKLGGISAKELERLSDKVSAEISTIGQYQKELSNYDALDILRRSWKLNQIIK
jgi:hypothetical protein